jgi:5-dehydro-4-deoxyglucarate dehydratase
MVTTPNDLRSKLHGAIGFPITPFTRDLSLDLDGFRKNLRAMLAHPFCAIVAAGGTGEIYALTPAEHLEIVRAAVEESHGRVPVIAGAGFNTRLGVELARQAADAGASGILAFPSYYPNADDEGIVEYYRTIGDATPLGLLVYSRDWFHPGPALVARLAARIPTLIGWKEGQGDIRRLQSIRSLVGDRLCWIGGAGDDLVPAYYASGIRAFTSSISNTAPELAIQLHEAASRGDLRAIGRAMADYIVPLYALRAKRRGYEVTVMKELMTILGLAGGPVRPPLPPLGPEDAAELRKLAETWSAARAHPA